DLDHARSLHPRANESAATAPQTRLKRIRFFARHDRAAARQHPHQMRIAVVDDVKEIEIAGARCQPPRIIPQSSGEAIAKVGAHGSADKRQSAPSTSHWRT